MKQGANDLAKQMFKKKLIAAIPAVAPFVLGALGFVILILAVVAPIAAAKEAADTAADNVGTFFERFGGFLTGKGWNTDEEAYFKLLNDEKLGCTNAKIVTATLMYYYQNASGQIEIGEDPDVDQNITTNEDGEYFKSDGNTLDYGKLYPDAKRLIKKIKKGMSTYEKYVKNTFLEQSPYNKLLKNSDDREKKKQKIYDEIISISEAIECPSSNYYLGYYSFDCPGVVVTGNYAGTYSLEEYIAGVVRNENGGAGIEGLKTQAILARTFLLKATNNCTTSIENSERQQTFSPATEEIYIRAAEETAGQVLTLNGELINTYYASYPKAGYNGFSSFPSCGSVNCDSINCTTTFYKMPNAESFEFTMPIKNQQGNYWNGAHLQNQSGHCYGFSQVVGRYLESTGVDYVGIIKTFHSDGVEIASSMLANGPGLLAADSSGFLRRVSWPDTNNLSDRNFWFSNNNLSYQGGYTGQCTWYAFGRANEILSLAGSNYRWKYAPNAKEWYKSNLNDGANGFKSSMDINSPKIGSILVLSGNRGAGHVAIVEGVYDDGDIAISEGNITGGNSNPYGFRYIEKINPNSYVKQFSRNGYSFGGYIYLLD